MSTDETHTELSEEQQRLLEHERFQAEVQRIRGQSDDSERPESGWHRFFRSAGGAALITVAVGGLLGTFISWNLERLNAQSERRYLTHQKYLEARLATIRPTLERVSHTVAAAEDLITITLPEWELEKFEEGPNRDATLAKRTAIRQTYNDADLTWRKEKGALGYLLVYYHGRSPQVSEAWGQVDHAVTTFVDCARRWWTQHGTKATEEATTACSEERIRVDHAMDDLIGTLAPNGAPGADDPG